jgi:hypothetical protein
MIFTQQQQQLAASNHFMYTQTETSNNNATSFQSPYQSSFSDLQYGNNSGYHNNIVNGMITNPSFTTFSDSSDDSDDDLDDED